jgi:DNA polymerase IV
MVGSVILHADIDAFYASVAERDEPALRGKPLVVAGRSRRAVVLTASYEARRFGIHSAMPLYQARERCADLLVVPPDFEKYHEASEAVFVIFKAHARAVEGLSLDEAFLDLGELVMDAAVAVAREVKTEVHAATRLTVSVGLASGKMVAKIASDEGKPDGFVCVPPGTEAEYLASKPVRRLWGIGPKTEARLRAHGLERIGQIAALSDEQLYELFGRWGRELRDLARGIDPRPVVEDWEARSISSEETFEDDVTDQQALQRVVAVQAAELAQRLRRKHIRAHTVGIKVKFSDRSVLGRQTSFREAVDDTDAIAGAAVYCLTRLAPEKPVRLIGVRVSNLASREAAQSTLFEVHGSPA